MARINFTATTDNGKAIRNAIMAWTKEKSINEVMTETVNSTIKKYAKDNAESITDLNKAVDVLTVNSDGKKRFPIDRTTEKELFADVVEMLPFGEVTAKVDVTPDCDEVVTGLHYSDGLFSGYIAVYNGESRKYFDNAVKALVSDLFKGDGNSTDLSNYLLASVGYTATKASVARVKGVNLAKCKTEKQLRESIVHALANYFNTHGMDCIDRTTANKLQAVADKRIEKRFNLTADNFKRLLTESGLLTESETVTATLKATA